MSYSLMLLLLPLQGIIFIWPIKLTNNTTSLEVGRKYIKVGLLFTIQNLFLTQILQHLYDPNISNFQFQLYLFDKIIGGQDGISQWLIQLVNLITPVVILNSWKTIGLDTDPQYAEGNHSIEINNNQKRYIILVLLVNFFSVAIFFVLDLLLFYISFEGADAFNYLYNLC